MTETDEGKAEPTDIVAQEQAEETTVEEASSADGGCALPAQKVPEAKSPQLTHNNSASASTAMTNTDPALDCSASEKAASAGAATPLATSPVSEEPISEDPLSDVGADDEEASDEVASDAAASDAPASPAAVTEKNPPRDDVASKTTTSDPLKTTTSSPLKTTSSSPSTAATRRSSLSEEDEWDPAPAEVVWTRINKSRTQALGIVIRRPGNRKADPKKPAVSCDLDGPDRYLVAYINSDAHVHPPRHYLSKFDLSKALELKCFKSKVSTLTPWEKIKRKAIRDVRDYRHGSHKFENSHNFRLCCTCCDEGEDDFWKAIALERGDVHKTMAAKYEKQKLKARKEAEARELKAQERIQKLELAAKKDTKKRKVSAKKEVKAAPEVSESEESEENSEDEASSSSEDEEEASSSGSSEDESVSGSDEEESESEEDDYESEDYDAKPKGRGRGKRRRPARVKSLTPQKKKPRTSAADDEPRRLSDTASETERSEED